MSSAVPHDQAGEGGELVTVLERVQILADGSGPPAELQIEVLRISGGGCSKARLGKSEECRAQPPSLAASRERGVAIGSSISGDEVESGSRATASGPGGGASPQAAGEMARMKISARLQAADRVLPNSSAVRTVSRLLSSAVMPARSDASAWLWEGSSPCRRMKRVLSFRTGASTHFHDTTEHVNVMA